MTQTSKKQVIGSSILIAALGYFVDIYDLVLFSIVRIKSLKGIGLPDAELLSKGVLLLNMQMAGMLLGGILWGILGDKKGRLSVLFGSIFLYSAANIANGFVQTVEVYSVLRFIAGVGLAGELGAGITLVSEVMDKKSRGYGTMVVATIGILGAVVAALVGDLFDWRTAYFIGGGLGLALLIFRISVYESGMFHSAKLKNVKRGSFSTLFRNRKNIVKYVSCIFIGMPIWYVIGILITFSPEFGKALGMADIPDPGKAIMFAYVGLALGDFTSGSFAQIVKSRKKVTAAFILLTTVFIGSYLLTRGASLKFFYANCLALGFSIGYWAVFVTIASEQFGTNIRSTVTTTVPNFVRGAVVPLTFFFQLLKPNFGIIGAAAWVGSVSLFLAVAALGFLEETHGKDLDYCE